MLRDIKILTGLVLSRCVPHWLSDKLADLYQWGELECPASVGELSQHIFEVAQDPKRALGHTVKEIESWDQVQSGNDQAELELVDKFLDLYELTSYYQVYEAFLSFKVLEAFASKITNDMLCEWHYHIGDNVSDEQLLEKLIQFLRSRPGECTATQIEVSFQTRR